QCIIFNLNLINSVINGSIFILISERSYNLIYIDILFNVSKMNPIIIAFIYIKTRTGILCKTMLKKSAYDLLII
ncbi:TPA: hypothetical protein MIR03_25555, partial [Klebsiella pneumoniae]|nr:hypothetical protein [Klebsiella pneumoniae]